MAQSRLRQGLSSLTALRHSLSLKPSISASLPAQQQHTCSFLTRIVQSRACTTFPTCIVQSRAYTSFPTVSGNKVASFWFSKCGDRPTISLEKAKQRIYACDSTTVRFFGAKMTKEESEKFNGDSDKMVCTFPKNMNILRPLSPHLPVYEPQLNSTLSISNRISGAFLATIVLFYYLLYLKMPSICFTSANFYQISFYSSKLIPISVEIAALALSYHLFYGVRHLLRDFSYFYKIR